MTTIIYDNSFPGLLTAVFEVYEYRLEDVSILPKSHPQNGLFGDNRQVYTDNAKAERVWKGILKHSSHEVRHRLYQAFLSELPGMEDRLLQYIQLVLNGLGRHEDYSHDAVLFVAETAKKVQREKHRMEAFVRFRQTADDLYYATITPDFNVLPLISAHFERRYADQRWLIYDMQRSYGLYYDLDQVSAVEIDFRQLLSGRHAADPTLDKNEKEYERLWVNYFNSVNIASRKNPKLHRQHMPLRYWKYLTEKW